MTSREKIWQDVYRDALNRGEDREKAKQRANDAVKDFDEAFPDSRRDQVDASDNDDTAEGGEQRDSDRPFIRYPKDRP